MVNEQGDIKVIYDYQNVIYIDPNKIVNSDGSVNDRGVKPEDFVMYANLETKLIPRTKLLVGTNIKDDIRTISLASINFLKPNTKDDFFTSSYYDEFTGKNSMKKEGVNQKRSEVVFDENRAYFKNDAINVQDNSLFGIKKISIKTTSAFIPTVTITMEDVQGRALFSLGNQSPYSAFFNLPYPPFYLTIKGYYGKAVRYELVMTKFNSRFNSSSGDYSVDLEFLGYKYNVLSDISIGHLLACPHMYTKKYEISTQPNTQTQVSNKIDINTELGYQKIIEVYKDYKSKNLLDQTFPELTLSQLINKLEMFEQNILNSLNKVQVQKLTDGKKYKSNIELYYKAVRSGAKSWFNKYIDSRPIILKSEEENTFKSSEDNLVYSFKDDITKNPTENKIELAISELKKIIDDYNKSLLDNETFGKNRTHPINNNINYDLLVTSITEDQIDCAKTFESRGGFVSPNINTNEYCKNIRNKIFIDYTLDGVNKTAPFFVMNKFTKEINKIESKFILEYNNIEKALSLELAKKIENKETGIGFKPTIKNIIAVIMASTEAFLRLLEDVHENAWAVKEDLDRFNSVINDDNNDIPQNEKVVFPWPLVFYETNKEKANKYELIYPGDPNIIQTTKAYYYDKWPEVEFVEEYLKGLVKRFDSPSSNDVLNNDEYLNTRFCFNTNEYPFTNLPYFSISNTQFLYEIWDRHFYSIYTSGLGSIPQTSDTTIIDFVSINEFKNIKTSLESNSILFLQKLQKYLNSEGGLDGNNYNNLLLQISNGVSENYQRYLDGYYNTNYINNLTSYPSQIYNIDTYTKLSDKFSNPIKSEFDINKIVDKIRQAPIINNINWVYPYSDSNWVESNLGIKDNILDIYNTKDTILFNTSRNVITNFREVNDIINNRPFKYFPDDSTKKLTYGEIYQDNYLAKKSISLLNTPIFINAISSGIEKWRVNNNTPFVTASYIFLNSLPLANLNDFFIDKNTNKKNGFVFSSFVKYSAIHKLPYAWILKYGSIWHRYKTYVNSNVDILDEVWKDFDYKQNYNTDPDFVYNVNKDIKIKLKDDKNINTGFYPKLINDYNVFVNGFDLFKDYTNEEISSAENRGIKIINTLNYTNKSGYTFNNWGVLVPQNIYDSIFFSDYCEDNQFDLTAKYYTFPSFNSFIQETETSSYLEDELLKVTHNGSIRVIYGDGVNTFDFNDLKKPSYNEYFNVQKDTNNAFTLGDTTTTYSSIEDIFAVFDYETLNLFEKEFLDFSKSIYNIDIVDDAAQISLLGLDYQDENTQYRNFQLLFRQLMEVPPNSTKLDLYDFLTQSEIYQTNNIKRVLSNFLNYDVLFKYGNPTQYNHITYNSLLNHISNKSSISNPVRFNPYVRNTLPNEVSLLVSEAANPAAWKALKLYVGFSTINGLKYADTNSSITDFFIENSIEFNEANVIRFAHLIKIYATQKYKNPQLTSNGFYSILKTNQDTLNSLLSDTLTNTLLNVKKDISNVSIAQVNVIDTAVDSKISKYDLYETFKAINDKWISGSDFRSRTLFEDVLFLDRGSRNIGDLYYADIFDLKRIFNDRNINLNMPVFNFIGGLLTKNNFNIFPMPSYVNFYGALSPGDSINDVVQSATEVANDTWGLFTNVDYRKSGPKLVCVYSGRDSTTLKGNRDFRFYDDSFDWDRSQEIPFLEDQTNKSDWSQSNKCVSFLVDVGAQNQAIFYGVDVDQNNGTATAESIQMIENIRNSVSNRGVATQNNSMFNLYKNLSYTATIRSMGNALIQPTMYFKLQHLPMFEGPYFITEVSHEIGPGSFETMFKGVRQSIYSPPTIDTYLSSINENLLTKIQSQFSKTIQSDKIGQDTATNNNQASKTIPTNSSGCGVLLYSAYAQFSQNNEVKIETISSQEMYKAITEKVPNVNYANLIYIISYLASFDGKNFKANHFNFGNVWLTYNRGRITEYNQNIEQFFCAKNLVTDSEIPFALFPSLGAYIDYMARVIERVYGKLDKWDVVNANDSTRAPIVDAYIIDWLYGEDTLQINLSSNTYAKLNSNGYYDKLKLKTKDAANSIKAINPKAFEVEVENVVKTNNSIRDAKKINTIDEGCVFTYKAPSVKTNMKIGEIKVPYTIVIKYSAKKIEELFYTENVVKEIDNALIKLYASNINPEISNFDIVVKSGATGYDITFTTDIIPSSDKPYTSVSILGFKKPTTKTIEDLNKKIQSSQNYNKEDKINNKEKNISEYSIVFYYANYTKLNLYPKLI